MMSDADFISYVNHTTATSDRSVRALNRPTDQFENAGHVLPTTNTYIYP
jgi:hypothetical protein